MFFQILCLSALGVIHVGLGTSEGGRKYRSLGRVNDSENSFRCLTEGFHPDARDCRTFYRCVDFASNDFFRDYTEPQLTAFRFECGEGTVFDPDFNICNHPRQTRRAECGAWNTEGQNPDTYPSQDGENGGYRGQQGNQGGYPMGYPGGGNQDGFPMNYPGGGNQEGYPVNYPGGGNQGAYPGQGWYPNESENQLMPNQQETYPGGYPGSGGMQGQGGYPRPAKPQGQGGYPGLGGAPGQGYPGQGGYPGPEGSLGQGGYPGPTEKPDQGGYLGSGGYPGPNGPPGQGGYPGPTGKPNEGGYPGSGGQPGERPGQGGSPGQGNYPGPTGKPGQGGYPGSGGPQGQGGSPGQGSYPGPTGKPGQGGYPGSGGYPGPNGPPGQGGYPGPTGKPNEGGYPGSGGQPGERPGQGGSPGQGNYPGPTGKPGQGGYPGSGGPQGQGGSPGQGSYPGPTGKPGQGSYPGSGGYPGPGGPPGQGGDKNPRPTTNPGQGGYPGSPGNPGQGGSSGSGGHPGERPGQGENGSKPEGGPQGPVFSGECNAPGFFKLPGSCRKFVRCVDHGLGGYNKYEFECGEGTAWDAQLQTCNHAHLVEGCGKKTPSKETGETPGPAGKPGSPGSGGHPGERPGQGENGSKPEGGPQGPVFSGECNAPGFFRLPGSCRKFVRCVDHGMGGYNKYEFECDEGTAWDAQLETCKQAHLVEGCGKKTPSKGSGRPQGQGGDQGPSGKPGPGGMNSSPSQSTPSYNNFTSTKPTTVKPEMSSQGKDPSQPPPGSSPCDQNKLSGPVKCEKDGFYPDPMDCSKFYRCADWGNKTFSVYYFECGPGTIWDPAVETCNHEKSVYPPRNCNRPNGESAQQPNSMQSTPGSTKQPSTQSPTTPVTSPATSTKYPVTSSEPSTTASVSNPEDLTTPPITSPESLTTNPTTGFEDSSTMATESSTPMFTTPSSSTDFTEPTTKSSSEGPITSTTSSEESPEGSTISQTDSTTSNRDQTESTTSQEMMTTRPSGGQDPKCPDLNEDQSAFVCPTGFRRHPKDCNTFYQCTMSKDTGELNIMLFSCKKDTVYDERKIQCLPAEETEPCQQQPQGRVYRSAREEFSSVVYVSPYKRLCPEEGSFPYEGDCTRFYKCKKDTRGKIQGYLYQCPENYSFDEATGRCEESSELPACGRSIPEVTARTLKWMKDKVPVDYSFL